MNLDKSYYLRVVKVMPAEEAKNGNGSFKKVTFEKWVDQKLPSGKVMTSPTGKSITKNLWTSQERSDGTMSKAHFLYDTVHEGLELVGTIEVLDTTEYPIVGSNGSTNLARKLSVVVFDSENGIDVANSELADRNACVVKINEETGEITNTRNLTELREKNTLREKARNKKTEEFENEKTK
jgi:hypothetical protein